MVLCGFLEMRYCAKICIFQYLHFNTFQCDCTNILVNNETIHLLTHYVMQSEDKIREYMHFVDKNLEWATQGSASNLEWQKLELSDCMEWLLQPGVPWDELALLIFAKMYKTHIFLLMSDGKFWSTSLSQKLMLALFGFDTEDTLKKGKPEEFRAQYPKPTPCPHHPTPSPPPCVPTPIPHIPKDPHIPCPQNLSPVEGH